MTTDIVIVGKGMAALVLAFLLKQKGIDHVILDRSAKVKNFDLAETLPPSALPLLQSLGLLSLFETHSIRKTYGYHALWGSDRLNHHNFYFHHPFKYGLKINKRSLITAMEGLCNSPVLSYENQLNISVQKQGLQIQFKQEGKEKNIAAKIVVDATGRNRAILKSMEIPTLDYDEHLAFSCHLPKQKHPDLKHDVFVESFEEGWGLVSGLGVSKQVMSIFSHQGSSIFKKAGDYQNWPEILKKTKYLKHFLDQDTTHKVTGKQANSSRPEKMADSNWLAIGDAALAFDPLSSHGISNAIYTATKAAETITGKLSFTQYDDTLSNIFNAYLVSRSQMYQQEKRWASKPYWMAQHQSSPLVKSV